MDVTEILGYATVVHYIADNHLDIHADDDVADAIVELSMNFEHFTDEQLDEAVSDFRKHYVTFNEIVERARA